MEKRVSHSEKPGVKPGMKKDRATADAIPAPTGKGSAQDRSARAERDLNERALWKKQRRAYWSSQLTRVLSAPSLRKAKAKKS